MTQDVEPGTETNINRSIQRSQMCISMQMES